MEKLCHAINMPPEVTQQLLDIHSTLPVFPCLPLLMKEETWQEGLEQLNKAVGNDPDGFRTLCCMLRCALEAKTEYTRLGICDEIYTDTMAAFSRFVREHLESYGRYGFDRAFWTPRQISVKLLRIEQLEYELAVKDGEPVISLHIPADADLRPEILRPSLQEGLNEFCRIFPACAGRRVYCHSWLMSAQLKDFLPEKANILRFQELFDIIPDPLPGTGVLQWVFKNPHLPPEEYPENTCLQKKLKRFILDGGQFFDGKGYLHMPL